jgi:hypothetical protein
MDGMQIPPRPDLGGAPQPRFEAWEAEDWSRPIPRRRAPRALAVVVAVSMFLLAAGALVAKIPDLVASKSRPIDHSFLYPALGEPVRWNPCEPIHYVVRLGRAPTGSLEDVHIAVERVSAATGITFVDDGLTDEIPVEDRTPSQPGRYGQGWAPVIIAWVDPSETDIPFVDDEGDPAAGVAQAWVPPGERVIVTAWVVINERDPNPPGFSAPGAQGPTVQHELGHVMGLGHVDSPSEMMHPAGGRVTDFGAGDLAGLAELGATQGCLETPRP